MELNFSAVKRNTETFYVCKHPEDAAESWLWSVFDNWESETFALFDKVLSSDTTYIDVGAWIGITPLYAASRGARVFAFEPDPTAFGRFAVNLELNQNLSKRITAFNAAFWIEAGVQQLYFDNLGDSRSSLLLGSNRPAQLQLNNGTVNCISLDGLAFLTGIELKKGDIIKIDIEGGEEFLIPAIAKNIMERQLTLYLSLHPRFWEITGATPLRQEMNRLEQLVSLVSAITSYAYCYTWNISAGEWTLASEVNDILEPCFRGGTYWPIEFSLLASHEILF